MPLFVQTTLLQMPATQLAVLPDKSLQLLLFVQLMLEVPEQTMLVIVKKGCVMVGFVLQLLRSVKE